MNNDCPNCQNPIRISDVMQAGLPNMIKCSKCKERIHFNIDNIVLYSTAIISVAIALFASLALTSFIQQHLFIDTKRLFVWLPIAFVFTLIAEYLLAKWLLSSKGLAQRSS
jgi:uncharacterized protein (DUF983 family)